ncbi:MAG TPA: malectin domain-containing carbohydrate-binding protein [Tepidisphaeraceae bacterium]|jgi:hypothetical protein
MRAIQSKRQRVSRAPARIVRSRSIEPLERRLLLSEVYTIRSTDDAGSGTLRGAIQFSNGDPNRVTTIVFDLEGSGVHTIMPLSPLPAITAHVNIQGTTDSKGNPLIEIDGHLAGATANGLTFARNTPDDTRASNVSGLIIDRFSNNGIDISGTGPTNVFGCRIGTDPTGKHAHPNAGNGIAISTPACQIGRPGVGPAFVNLISGNSKNGINIGSAGADAIVQNCLIGTDVSGKSARPNFGSGIEVDAAFSSIGGRRVHEGNVISGNAVAGVVMTAGNCDILGNRIGTNAAGTGALGNGTNGIDVENAVNVNIGDSTAAGRNLISGNKSQGIFVFNTPQTRINNNLIGTDVTGTLPLGNFGGIELNQLPDAQVANCVIGGGQSTGLLLKKLTNSFIQQCFIGVDPTLKHAIGNGSDGIAFLFTSVGNSVLNNTIADNTGSGVIVRDDDCIGNRISENSIFSNGKLGIQLGNITDPLLNRPGTLTGPNDDQNYPSIDSALVSGGHTSVTGKFNSIPNGFFTLEFFGNASADPSGFGEGQVFLGSERVQTDAQGNADFNAQVDPAGFGQSVTATAVGTQSGLSDGDTSEFSPAIAVKGAAITGTVFNDVNGNGKLDSGEKGLKGRTVFIDDDKDGQFNSAADLFGVTDSHGRYTIFGLVPDVHRVRILGTAGFALTTSSFRDVAVAALSTKANVRFGERKSTAAAAQLAIDAGASAPYVDRSGQTFAADTNHDDANTSFDVLGTDDDPLYYVLVSGHSISYSFNIPNGKYRLKLFFVDATSSAAGQRTFNVSANGVNILKHFDIFATAKAASTAVIATKNLTITNKKLSLNFKGVIGDATVSAIELIPV